MKLLRRTFEPDEAIRAVADVWENAGPGFWAVQGGCVPPPAHRPSRLLAGFAAQHGMALSLRTDTLLEGNVGATLSHRLDQFGCALGDLAGLALHEILVNAAVHGNLQVASRPAARWREREAHSSQIEAGLADPELAARVVTVALGWHATLLCACVIDEGAGYTPAPDSQPAPSVRKAAGRGLSIARAAARVDVLRGGCCTRLLFDRAPPPAEA
jgi:hypothetical protein